LWRIATRHNGGANFMFAAGHAKRMTPSQWIGPANGIYYYHFWRGGSACRHTEGVIFLHRDNDTVRLRT
jgi:prepilin-type processing-associated H-X9-DG protein